MTKLLLVGCGNLGQNIISGFYKKNKRILICDENKNLLKKISKNYQNFFEVSENIKNVSIEKIKYILLCIKPQQALEILKIISKKKNQKIKIISFVAGLKEKKIQSFFDYKVEVIRIMPNLLLKVNKSTTGIFSSNLSVSEKKKIENNFSFFGRLIWLKKENQMDFFTAFFGGGPAYLSFFFEILSKILIKRGFNKKISSELVLILASGTVEIIGKSLNFEDIVKKVASKNGTTEKALNFLKKDKKLSFLISQAISKAEKRSMEIAKDLL
jgi:pyrroline-5-carboxylate reductase